MTPERWRQIDDLLHAARELPQAQQADLVAERCGDDSRLAREVLTLLARDESETFLDRPVFSVHELDPDIGRRVGAYELVQRLGQGGMGAVYLAVRQDDYHHRVAVKWVQRGLDSTEVVRRFQSERQILADLEHPNIARLHDGGTTDDGRLYFVMEYIDGEPIDRYCEHQQCSVRERLRLFLQVCDAVQLSHQRLVIHRDIKPGNILIDKETGVPKLLDFGIAKVLQPDHRDIRQTTPGRQPLTLRYASPEQLRGEAVTTASDIYSLGVLLYQLLCGCHPLGWGLPDSGSNELEILLRLERDAPARPSTAVWGEAPGDRASTDKDGKEPLGVGAWADRRRWRRRLRGDLDAIVLKALRFEPDQRYGSVFELAADIRRHLEGEVVLAHKGSWTYRLAKSLRRHRVAVAFTVMGTVFGGISTWLALDAQEQKQRVEEARSNLRFFLEDLLVLLSSKELRSQEIERKLSRIRERMEVNLRADPKFWVDHVGKLAGVFRRYGGANEAAAILLECIEVLQSSPGTNPSELAEVLNNYSVNEEERGNYETAEVVSRRAVAIHRDLGHEGSIEIVKTNNNLASILTRKGEFEEASKLYEQGLAIRREHYENRDPRVALSLRSLGNLQLVSGDLAGAARSLGEALEMYETSENSGLSIASAHRKLAQIRQAQGLREEARELFQSSLPIQRERYGADHRRVVLSELFFADFLLDPENPRAPELSKAEELLIRASNLADNTWEKAIATSLWGDLQRRRGRAEEACPNLVEGYRDLHRIRSPRATYTKAAKRRLATFAAENEGLVLGDLDDPALLACRCTE